MVCFLDARVKRLVRIWTIVVRVTGGWLGFYLHLLVLLLHILDVQIGRSLIVVLLLTVIIGAELWSRVWAYRRSPTQILRVIATMSANTLA